MAAEALDVRARRTRDALREAVLRLASELPVEQIAVADLVRTAKINRTTFYKHAASPAEVLEQVLYADLDRLRANWLTSVLDEHLPADQIWERSTGELAAHLERFDGVYTTGLVGHRSAVLHRLLTDHFAASARALLERAPELLPDGAGSPQWRATAYSAFIAHGQTGIVEAWLTESRPRDRHLLITAVAGMLPTWLTATTPPAR
ncbi:hypothetical protein [Actinoplanes sp. NPDC051851]|uniref:TetR/AcrR family transcriptional regulator n=1 Tax=Actinoplanes sp. NPDC051851 TaxID=3154753 RepID=UPI0034356C89